jgi:hypothetical protein
MKWPNLADTMEQLKQKDSDFALDKISSDAFAFFSGLVLPGVSGDDPTQFPRTWENVELTGLFEPLDHIPVSNNEHTS